MYDEPRVCAVCADREFCVRRIPAFAELSRHDAISIMRLAKQKSCKKGTHFFNEGENGRELYLIRRGKIGLYRYGLEGEERLVALLGFGDIYGGDEIFVEKKHRETGIVLEDCAVCCIAKEDIRRLVLSRPDIGLKLAEYLNQKLAQNHDLLEIVSTGNALRRLAQYLIYYCALHDSTRLYIGQSEIAKRINLTKETVNRKMAELQQLGFVAVDGKKRLRLVSPERMKKWLNHAAPGM